MFLEERRTALRRLGVEPEIGAWCEIDRIPEPPKDVHEKAGGGRLRPAAMRPLGMLGTALAFPFKLLYSPLTWLDRLTGSPAVSQADQDHKKYMKPWSEQRDAQVVQQGLDGVFDGDWQGTAGQLLLRWYGKSSHHKRLLLLIQGRVILMAPPKRVTVWVAQRLQVMEDFSAGQAIVEDLFLDNPANNRLLVRFADGSWLVLTTEDEPSIVHRWLRHLHRLGDRADQASEADFIEEWSQRHRRRAT